MKHKLIIFCSLLFCQACAGQGISIRKAVFADSDSVAQMTTYQAPIPKKRKNLEARTSAQFPGGRDSLYCFVERQKDISICIPDSLRYIEENENSRQNEALQCIAFVDIDTNGIAAVEGIWAESDMTNECENDIKRIIATMPRWCPAVTKGIKTKREKKTIDCQLIMIEYRYCSLKR